MQLLGIGYKELYNYLTTNMHVKQKEPVYKYLELFSDIISSTGMILDTNTMDMYAINKISAEIKLPMEDDYDEYSVYIDCDLATNIPIKFSQFISNPNVVNIIDALWEANGFRDIMIEHKECYGLDDACIHNMIIYLSYMADLICTATQTIRYYFVENLLTGEVYEPSAPHNQIANQLHLQHLWNTLTKDMLNWEEDNKFYDVLLAPKIRVNKENAWSIEFYDLIVQYKQRKHIK